MTFNSFISGLENYLEDKNELDKLKEKKKDLEYLESNVKGVDPSKEHGSNNPSIIAQVRLAKIDDLCDLEIEIESIQNNLNRVMRQFQKQDDEIKKILDDIYIKKKKKIDVSSKLGFTSITEMDRYIKRSYVY